ncbi:hypothetical protein [Xanthobacter autotrophicus]|uniref:hypothetical protein n=1 Tax=Xanthobacter autotrophicus TaxID=280 RepID=UPI00372B669E
MSDNDTGFSVNRTERKVSIMSAVAKASEHLRELSRPCAPGEGVKGAINRVAKLVNDVGRVRGILRDPIRTSRIEDMWRKQARRIDAEEMDAIRAALALKEAAQKEKNVHDAQAEYAGLVARISALEAALRLFATDEGRASLAALLEEGRPLDSPLDRDGEGR